jgi:hypothetical protein
VKFAKPLGSKNLGNRVSQKIRELQYYPTTPVSDSVAAKFKKNQKMSVLLPLCVSLRVEGSLLQAQQHAQLKQLLSLLITSHNSLELMDRSGTS